MHKLIELEKNTEHNYNLYSSELVKENHEVFYSECFMAKDRFDRGFPNLSSTWTYRYYNMFSLTAGSIVFYELLKQLKYVIRDFMQTDEPLWFQSWLNFHNQGEVLQWHDHQDCSCHGFLSIEPRETKTVFEGYEVVNEVGKIYIGQANKFHKVDVLKDFDQPRITVAFDVLRETDFKQLYFKFGNDINLSLFPLN
jgi:hypothetical protein